MAHHKLSNKDVDLLITDCSECGEAVPMRISYTDKATGTVYWRCLNSYKVSKNRSERPYTVYKKDHCEWQGGCDATIVHPCMLTIDHIDGNKMNNDPSNLQTLCANHHNLKSLVAGDHTSWRKVAVI